MTAQVDDYCPEDSEFEMATSELDGSALEGMLYEGGGSGSIDARLESKRARNREAARRMRQRQRQHISKLEVRHLAGRLADRVCASVLGSTRKQAAWAGAQAGLLPLAHMSVASSQHVLFSC
jgi:hypothetical protein